MEKFVSAEGELKILSQIDGWKQKVELWLLNDKTNNNNWRYENLAEHMRLFAQTPILVAYVGNRVGDGHNFEETKDSDGNVIASFMSATAERIVGYFQSESDIRMEVRDGKEWIVGYGYIWKWYAQELVAKLTKQGREGMSISIETLIDEMHMDGTTEVFTKYQILGTTILGDDVAPAVTDANIRALSTLGADGVRRLTVRVASLNEQQNNPQTKNKKGVKANTMRFKELTEQFKGFTVLAEDGKNVALLSDNGALVMSSAEKNGEEIVVGAKTEVNPVASFVNGDITLEVSLDKIIEKFNAKIAALEQENAKVTEEKETVTASLKAMQTAETERRKNEIKKVVAERIATINANRDVKISSNACDELLTDECLDSYAEMVDKDGKWIGDIAARKDVDAKCMEEIIASEAQRCNAKKSHYAWDVAKNNDESKADAGVYASIENILK
ncbi:MAG: hypothetical protein IKU30_00960 [Clostridia bacterium]|nr:hypothetical protein [Clostridia bacterium]